MFLRVTQGCDCNEHFKPESSQVGRKSSTPMNRTGRNLSSRGYVHKGKLQKRKRKQDFDSHLLMQINILFKLAPDMTANMY